MCIRDSHKTDTEYHFTTAEQLAGLAQLVNDKTASVSFAFFCLFAEGKNF